MLHRVSRRAHLAHAALVGFLAGMLAVAYQYAVLGAEAAARWAAGEARSQGGFGVTAFVLIGSAIAALAAGMIGKFAPESGGSGIPHIKAALLHLRIIRPVRLIVAKFLGGLAALAVGMSFGREGPTVQMGASVGKLVGTTLRVPKRGRGTLVAAGAGAGLAAAFNAPLAGFLFVMEELKREMSALTYGSALIACVFAVGISRYLGGEHPSFRLPSPGAAPLSILPFAAVLGAIAGLAGVGFNRALLGALELRTKYRVPRWLYGAIVGAVSVLALIFFPYIAGGGHQVAEVLLSGKFTAQPLLLVVALVFVLKLFLTSASYGTGLPGGIFAPILVIGSFLGYAFGLLSHQAMPGLAFSDAGFATLGMTALLAGSVRAPLTGVVLIVEMTAEYGLLYALLVAAFVANLTAEMLHDKPIYEALMERDLKMSGAEVHPEEEPLLVEILVEPHSWMDGKRIKNLKLPAGAIVATLERGSRHIVPSGNTMLNSGDMITVMIEGDKPYLSTLIHQSAQAP